MFTLPRLVDRSRAIQRVAGFLSQLDPAKAWTVEVKPQKKARSDAQNRYLNGVAYKLIGDAIGYERDEISEFLCGTYWGWKEKRVPKKPSNPEGVESVPMRTTTTNETGKRSVLSKTEFSNYVAFVQRFAAKQGIHIPDPGESEWQS